MRTGPPSSWICGSRPTWSRYGWPVERTSTPYRTDGVGRRLHRSLLGCLGVAGLVFGGGTAHAQPPDDVLPDDIGPGWEIVTGEFCQLQPPWVYRCFEGPSGHLLVAAIPVIMDARFEAEFLASELSPAAESSPDLAAAWRVPPDGPDALRSYAIASERYVLLVTLFPSGRATDADDALLLDVARYVQARGGGPPTVGCATRGAARVGGGPRGGPAGRVSGLAHDPARRGHRPLRSARHDAPACGSCSSGRARRSCARSPAAA